MSLNIKNEHTHLLVRELAERTGLSQTRAVETAVRRMLDDLAHDHDSDAARRSHAFDSAISRLRALPTIGPSFNEITDEMYDDLGLPR